MVAPLLSVERAARDAVKLFLSTAGGTRTVNSMRDGRLDAFGMVALLFGHVFLLLSLQSNKDLLCALVSWNSACTTYRRTAIAVRLPRTVDLASRPASSYPAISSPKVTKSSSLCHEGLRRRFDPGLAAHVLVRSSSRQA
jgi:hypothetical protein